MTRVDALVAEIGSTTTVVSAFELCVPIWSSDPVRINAGSKSAIRTAIIAMTTSNSISVNPFS